MSENKESKNKRECLKPKKAKKITKRSKETQSNNKSKG